MSDAPPAAAAAAGSASTPPPGASSESFLQRWTPTILKTSSTEVTSPTAAAAAAAASNGNGASPGAGAPRTALPPIAPTAAGPPGSFIGGHSSVPPSPSMAALAQAAVPVPVGGYTGPASTAAKPKNTCGCSGGELAARDWHGPFLKVGGYVPELDAWTGSCLVVCKASACERPVLHWRAVPEAAKGVPVQPVPASAALASSAKPRKADGSARLSASHAKTCPTLVHHAPDACICRPHPPPADTPSDCATVYPVCLDTFCDWNFWRFDLAIPVVAAERRVEYRLEGEPKGANASADAAALKAGLIPEDGEGDATSADPPASPTRAFYVAGRDQPWHWGYYSCNGFTPDVPEEDHAGKWRGIAPLWEDVCVRHASAPMHAMVGGGDQLYNDDVLKCPALAPFFDAADEDARAAMPLAPAMAHEVAEYYFHHYATHYSYAAIGAAMARIPQLQSWDDHDIFDGWGSYPEALQESAVFSGIFSAARRFFLLFQMHTTPGLAQVHGAFGAQAHRSALGASRGGGPLASYSQLALFGPRVAVLLPDCRAERTESQVLSLETHMQLLIHASQLPETVRHIVVGTTVPVVYPHLIGGMATLKALGSMNKVPFFKAIFKATGVASMVFNDVDEPELLDDLRDHWSSPTHQDERRFLIEHLQMLAKARSARVTLISGDVHLCGVGRLYSEHRKKRADDPRKDYRLMYQIVCSAIGNAPPPDGLVKALHWMTKAHKTNEFTHDKMIRGFHDMKGRARLCNRRNWCEVWEIPEVGAPPTAAQERAAAERAAAAAAGASSSSAAPPAALAAGSITAASANAEVGQYKGQPSSVEWMRWPMAAHLDGRLHAAPGDLVFALRVEKFTKAPVIDGELAAFQFVIPTLAKPARHSAAGQHGKIGQQMDFYSEREWSRRYAAEDSGRAGGSARGSGVGKRGFHAPATGRAGTAATSAAALQGVRRAPARAGGSPAAVAPAGTSGAAVAAIGAATA